MTDGSTFDRAGWLAEIDRDITAYGFHITTVLAGLTPKYSYTIGLLEQGAECELILAGAFDLPLKTSVAILREFGGELLRAPDESPVGPPLRRVHPTWRERLMLGVSDRSGNLSFEARQVTSPDRPYVADEPDLSVPFQVLPGSVWRYLDQEWEFDASPSQWVTMNEAALTGARIDQTCHWDDGFEVLAHLPDGSIGDGYVVPLSTAVVLQPDIVGHLGLVVGECVRLEESGLWKPWD